MKTIIAGSREITDYDTVENAVKDSEFDITEIISGTARGVDVLGEEYGNKNNIPVKKFPANWNTFGKSAVYRRNEQMGDYADACIAIWDGKSKGTRHMIEIAKRKQLKLFIYILGENKWVS